MIQKTVPYRDPIESIGSKSLQVHRETGAVLFVIFYLEIYAKKEQKSLLRLRDG